MRSPDKLMELANDVEANEIRHAQMREEQERTNLKGGEILHGEPDLPGHLALERSVERSIARRRGAPAEWIGEV